MQICHIVFGWEKRRETSGQRGVLWCKLDTVVTQSGEVIRLLATQSPLAFLWEAYVYWFNCVYLSSGPRAGHCHPEAWCLGSADLLVCINRFFLRRRTIAVWLPESDMWPMCMLITMWYVVCLLSYLSFSM